jgi:hypothetical protein
MAAKENFKVWISLALTLLFLFLAVSPNYAENTAFNKKQEYSKSPLAQVSFLNQEVEEDEIIDSSSSQSIQVSIHQLPSIELNSMHGSTQQAKSFFFFQLFSCIASQAP